MIPPLAGHTIAGSQIVCNLDYTPSKRVWNLGGGGVQIEITSGCLSKGKIQGGSPPPHPPPLLPYREESLAKFCPSPLYTLPKRGGTLGKNLWIHLRTPTLSIQAPPLRASPSLQHMPYKIGGNPWPNFFHRC